MYGKPVTNVHGNFRKRVGSSRGDKKYYSKTAGMTNMLNTRRDPMRGGIRL